MKKNKEKEKKTPKEKQNYPCFIKYSHQMPLS